MSTATLIESLEWLLKRANGSQHKIDTQAIRTVLAALRTSLCLLLLAGTVNAQAPVFVPIVKPSSVIVVNGCGAGCPKSHGAKLSGPRLSGPALHTRAKHRNNDPYGRSHLDEHYGPHKR